ncbi:hypothetical protein Q9L58_007586 [Maublancomyces gigas]|uniref:Uncharacterized protein n=1 Tax=Discina gigas TaxID=1032678 RepID=A0ABR3GC23_9PEZI
MSEQARPPFDKRNSSTSSVVSGGNANANANANPNSVIVEQDTSSNDEQAAPTHQPSRHHHPPKKHHFVVGGTHSRHHTRVPSYGRNLNKLGKLTPLATSPGSKVRGEEKTRSAKRATFELGGDNRQNSNNDSKPSSYKEGYTNGNGAIVNTGDGTAPPVVATKGTTALVKSSSTKSLDRKSRDGTRKVKAEKHDRSQSKPRENPVPPSARQRSSDALPEMNSKRQSEPQSQAQSQFQLPTPPQPKVHPEPQRFQSQLPSQPPTHLLPHTKPSGAAPPKVSVESVQASAQAPTKIRRITAQQNGAYVTPAHSLPDSHEQPLTSRFIDSSLGNSNSISPSSAARAYGLSPSYRENLSGPDKLVTVTAPTSPTPPSVPTTTVNVTSRTQQKLWLQRQSSQHEVPLQVASQTRPGSEWYAFQSRAQKEFERVNREYLNTRRFKNPAVDSAGRIQDKQSERRIPRRREGQGTEGAGALGLSQSLKETGAVRKELKLGSKDDSAMKQARDGTGELQTILMRLWNSGEMLPSNE